MSECGAALQLFEDFGENWNALGECLAYLDEWMPASGYVLVFTEVLELLADESEELIWLLRVLEEAGLWWSKPIEDNGRFNRPSRPFHSVFQVRANERVSLPRQLRELAHLTRTDADSA
jgi:hypothetical protein